jgi:hypothetical protein
VVQPPDDRLGIAEAIAAAAQHLRPHEPQLAQCCARATPAAAPAAPPARHLRWGRAVAPTVGPGGGAGRWGP